MTWISGPGSSPERCDDFRSSDLGPGQDYCIVFLGNTLYNSTSLHSGV